MPTQTPPSPNPARNPADPAATVGGAPLHRTLLSLPANSERFLAKAAASVADVVMLDLEDAVAPGQKPEARHKAVEALNGLDWGQKTVLVRVNGLDTPWAYRDLVEVCESAARLDGVMVPKIHTASELLFVDTLLAQIEQATGRMRPIAIEILVESALGMTNVEAIAAATPRLTSISFGPGDYGASIHNRARNVGGPHPDYVILAGAPGARERHYNDASHYPMARIATACHAYGIIPMDGPFAEFKELEGLEAAAWRASALGYEGKWAIHPTQLETINRVFAPSAEEIEWAGALMARMEQAHGAGSGAISLGGQMVDMANVRLAERIVAKARRIAEIQR